MKIFKKHYIKYKKDGYCLQNTIYNLLVFFDIKNYGQLENIKSIYKMLAIIKKHNLSYYIYIPYKYIFTCIYFSLFVKFRKNICFSSSKFKKYIKKHKKYAIIHYVDAFGFYGIKELWTHFILEEYNSGDTFIFDSFYIMYGKEYHINTNILYEKLKSSKHIKILVYKG